MVLADVLLRLFVVDQQSVAIPVNANPLSEPLQKAAAIHSHLAHLS